MYKCFINIIFIIININLVDSDFEIPCQLVYNGRAERKYEMYTGDEEEQKSPMFSGSFFTEAVKKKLVDGRGFTATLSIEV